MKTLPRIVGVPRGHEPRTLRAWLVATTAAFLVVIAWQRVFQLAPIDDAYIFIRYAKHCALGLGPVFNPGERVEGLLLVAVAASFCWVRRNSVQWRRLLIPLIAFELRLIARRLYYGDWLPNT